MLNYLFYGGRSRFDNGAEGFLLQCCDATRDISGRGVRPSHVYPQSSGAILDSMDGGGRVSVALTDEDGGPVISVSGDCSGAGDSPPDIARLSEVMAELNGEAKSGAADGMCSVTLSFPRG